MSKALIPTAALLRSLSQQSTLICRGCQIRSTSSFMPRSKYAKLTRLDKLHRQQKVALREEKKESELRAQALEITLASQIQEKANAGESQSSQTFPFQIERTQSSNLPIYETTKAGGSKHITQIRKLTGDLDAMQAELRKVLQLPDFVTDNKGRKKDTVAINRNTSHIIVRGWRAAEIKKWAEMSGF